MVIKTNPQAQIQTTVTDSTGATRVALLTSKQFIFNKVRSLSWVPMSTFTTHISNSGIRARLSELRSTGYVFETRYAKTGKATSIRLAGFPGVGIVRATA